MTSYTRQSTYLQHAGALNRQLKRTLGVDLLRQLHRRNPWLHGLVALRQLVLLILLPWVIYAFPHPAIWIPCAILQGFVIFSFSVLLHEVIHKAVFRTERKRVSAVLGFVYGAISGLSSSQFKRWHLDHHLHLGSDTKDPKRAHLTPKRVSRLVKLLYCTPALIPIYFRAAARAQKDYAPALRRRIGVQRLAVLALHVGVIIIFWIIDPAFAVKGHIIPALFVFPVAFTLNRLGQHYLIDPQQVAHWSTLMQPNIAWNFLFLWSSYHLEHHYFPVVPFYRLKALNRALGPFYAQQDLQPVTYSRLITAWFIHNHVPHTAFGTSPKNKTKLKCS